MSGDGRRLSTLERAFEMARSGEFDSAKEIARSLVQEGFDQVAPHLSGPSIKKALSVLCIEARGRAAGKPRSIPVIGAENRPASLAQPGFLKRATSRS
jgi:hypothetical protein